MEVVELGVHLVEHGDLAHGDSDRHGTSALGVGEHGCSGTFHLCGCHSASVITPTPSELQAHHAASSRTASFVSTGRDGLGATAPPHRPPIT